MNALILTLFFSLTSGFVWAQTDQTKLIETSQTFGSYKVHYNVFNSTDIPAKVASAYKLVRGKDRALLNISVTNTADGATTLGLPAEINVATRNLMQQTQKLKIIKIEEGAATYYLAPFVFSNEELLHFDIQVITESKIQMNITFNRTLYTDK